MPVSLFFIFVRVFPILVRGACGVHTDQSSRLSDARLLLVSFDGFRHDYLDRGYSTPHIDSIVAHGVRVKSMRNAFVTSTFPSHYTLATGLYPESHGIVANSMFNPKTGEKFRGQSGTCGTWWDGGEPVWNTVRQQGGKVACMNWPGSACSIRGVPACGKPYDKSYPSDQRVDDAIAALSKGTSFVALYFETPDDVGHRFGPNSPEIQQAVETSDNIVGRILEGLRDAGLSDEVDVIITADHGMASTSPGQTVLLDTCAGLIAGSYRLVNSGAVAGVALRQGLDSEEAGLAFTALEQCHPKMRAYKKEDLPSHLHYSKSDHIPPIVLLAEEGWTIAKDKPSEDLGAHGWDSTNPSMRPVFLAKGPHFPAHLLFEEEFSNVDVYGLMSIILGLRPAPNDGSPSVARALLRLPALTFLSQLH